MIQRSGSNGNGRGNGKPPSDPAFKALWAFSQTEFKKLDAILANQQKQMRIHDAMLAKHDAMLEHQLTQIDELKLIAIRQQAHLEGIDAQLGFIRRQQQADHRVQRAMVHELTRHSAALAEILRRLPKRPPA